MQYLIFFFECLSVPNVGDHHGYSYLVAGNPVYLQNFSRLPPTIPHNIHKFVRFVFKSKKVFFFLVNELSVFLLKGK
jgi:hypothetical protein